MLKQSNILKICIGRRTKNGKAELNEKWLRQVFLLLKNKRVTKPAVFIYRVLSRLRPPIGLKSKKIAGAKVKIPSTLPIRQQYLKALNWVFEGAKKRARGFNTTPKHFVAELYSVAKFKRSHALKLRRIYLRALMDSRAFLKHLI